MKNIVYRLFGLVAISFCVCLAQAEDVWTLVTDASTLQIGDKVVIVSSVDNRALGTTQKTNNRNAVEITKNTDNTCVINENVQQLTLHQGKKTNTFAFYTGNGYLYAASSSDNHLKTEASLSNNSSWSISITSEGIATIVAQGTYGNNNLRYNPTTIFSAYPASSTGTRMTCLYKLSEVQKQPTTIQFNDNAQIAEYESYIGASFSLPSEASVIEGLEFVGWSKEPIVAGAAVANDAILSPGTLVVVEEDMTFYAVYAKPVESGESAYIKVETEQEDWSGTYLIVCESSGKAFNSSLGKSALFPTDGLNVVDIAINDSKIAHNEVNEQYEFVIAKYNEGYSIKSKSGYYIGNKISSGDFIGVASTTEMSFKFEYKNEHSPLRMNGAYLCYDNSSGFSYSIGQHTPIQLYKRSETTKSYAFYTTSLSTEVAINKYGYSTWYAGMPVAVPEGMKAYYCIVDGNTAVLNDMGTVIPANTGAVLYAEEAIGTGGSYAMSYTNESITIDITKNLLIGYVQDTEVNNGKAHYALNVKDNVVGFYVPKTTEEGTTPSATSTFTAKAGKAYLELEPTASAVSLVIRRNSDTSIDAAIVIPENIIYDLTGRRVITPSKGIYIVNGRKITM